jgi:methionyl-tRNA formyltransferase
MVNGAGTLLRIVLFGTPEFAVPSLEALLASPHQVVGVVTRPDQPSGRGHHLQPPPVKRAALIHNLPILQPERLTDDAFLRALAALEADVAVVAAYGKIFGESLLRTLRLGFINVHASLLPRFRGAAPVHRAVMAGETVTGVTIMRIVRALDAGPMLAAASRPIAPDETSDQVERGLSTLGASLLVAVVDDLAHGRAVEVAQDESQATYAPRLEKSDGVVDWRQPAKTIHDRVRGLHPWPHAHTYLDTTRYILLHTRVEPSGTRAPGARAAEAGEIIEAAGDVLRVATGDGSLGILEVQAEGRRASTAREFLAGHPIRAGAIFGRPRDCR